MTYPGFFHRIVVIGTLYTAETFNWTMNVVPTENPLDVEEVTPTLATDIKNKIAAWFPATALPAAPSIIQSARLTEVKVNRINAQGKYADNEVHTVPVSPVVGGAASGNLAAQLSLAVTLRTARERGRGSRGRFYLPPISGFSSLGTDGRLTAAQALQQANSAKALVESINLTYWARDGGLRTGMMVGVASNIGTGIFEAATRIEVGRVPDTMRSRRSSLPEDHQEVTVAPPA